MKNRRQNSFQLNLVELTFRCKISFSRKFSFFHFKRISSAKCICSIVSFVNRERTFKTFSRTIISKDYKGCRLLWLMSFKFLNKKVLVAGAGSFGALKVLSKRIFPAQEVYRCIWSTFFCINKSLLNAQLELQQRTWIKMRKIARNKT